MVRRNPAETANLKQAAWEFRSKGLTGTDIAQAINVPQGTVYQWLKEMTEEASARARDTAEAAIHLELARIDRWQSELESQMERWVEKGRSITATVTELARLSERRAKLMGLDKPEQVQMAVTEVTQLDLAFEEMVREAQAAEACNTPEPADEESVDS